MRIRCHKPHQLDIDLISHKVAGPRARFKTFKHRGVQVGAFGGRPKVGRMISDGFSMAQLTTLPEPMENG